jgi:Raf kinase inhibitor-like YbhB/YbcL family protein
MSHINNFSVTTSAFEHGQNIPKKYSGDGADVSPPLAWSKLPAAARSLAVVCDDPDAPIKEPWVHWVIFNIPASMTALPEGVEKTAAPRNVPGAAQGHNSWSRLGWNGPLPPKGHGVHHYHFRVYALNEPLVLAADVDKNQLLAALQNHLVGQAEIIGTYERK